MVYGMVYVDVGWWQQQQQQQQQVSLYIPSMATTLHLSDDDDQGRINMAIQSSLLVGVSGGMRRSSGKGGGHPGSRYAVINTESLVSI